MSALRILVTGDYWHKDFQSLIGDLQVTTTMVTLEKLTRKITEPDFDAEPAPFDLIAIAQSRQGQFDQATVDAVKEWAGITPVIMVLGSWCEGELRSDTPIEGVKRVYWHQWSGRFTAFTKELEATGIALWHSTGTASIADDVKDGGLTSSESGAYVIGVSAWNRETYQTLALACRDFGWQTRWVERSRWINLASEVDVFCVDAGSQYEELKARLSRVREKVPEKPIVLMMNFPRESEVAELEEFGVSQVISMPLELRDLKNAIESAIASAPKAQERRASIPAPKMSRERKALRQNFPE